jgi:hypothetical protein
MDRDVLDTIEREIDQEVRARFPGSAVRQAVLLQYGDDPEIEPGICGSGCCSTRTGRRTTRKP